MYNRNFKQIDLLRNRREAYNLASPYFIETKKYIKKGIIELADLIVVNKADSDLKKTAEITVRDYKTALSIIGNKNRNEKIEVLKKMKKK